MAEQRFIEAQAQVLDQFGIVAHDSMVDCETAGGQAHVLVAGSGPPLVLIAGIGLPAAMWAPLLAELDGFTTYAVDLPGYGLTTTAPSTDRLAPAAVAFLTDVLDGLGLGQAAFVANSLGSRFVMWLADADRDRVGSVAHIGCPAVALDTSAPLPMRILSTPLGRFLYGLQSPSARQITQLSKMVGEYPLPPTIAELILATELLPSFDPAFLGTLQALLRLRGGRPVMALSESQVARLRQPMLYVFGADDPFGGPEVGHRLADASPDAAVHVVAGGHAPWIHHADQIAPVVADFVRTSSASC